MKEAEDGFSLLLVDEKFSDLILHDIFNFFQQNSASLGGDEGINILGETTDHFTLLDLTEEFEVGEDHLDQEVTGGVQGGHHQQVLLAICELRGEGLQTVRPDLVLAGPLHQLLQDGHGQEHGRTVDDDILEVLLDPADDGEEEVGVLRVPDDLLH